MPQRPLIMVATDLSARCDRAVDRGRLLADQLGGRLLAVHVAGREPPSPDTERQLTGLLAEQVGEGAGEAGLEIAHGAVPATLARIAEERGAALILTGVARLNDVRDYVLGTAVEALIRQSRVPVLVVKQRPARPYRRILAATDFSDCAQGALAFAARLLPEAELRAVHAYHAAYEGFLDQEETERFAGDESEQAMRDFAAALPEEAAKRLETANVKGEISDVVYREVGAWQADLLAIGSHGRSGLAQATIGSRAVQLLRAEPVDTLVVRTGC